MGFEREKGKLTCRMKVVFGGKRGASKIVSCCVFLPLRL